MIETRPKIVEERTRYGDYEMDTVIGHWSGENLDSAGYFANPYHSWERGLNENTNGLMSQYFPKQTDFGKITEDQIHELQEKLNNKPRKCLGWRTAHEKLSEQASIVAVPR